MHVATTEGEGVLLDQIIDYLFVEEAREDTIGKIQALDKEIDKLLEDRDGLMSALNDIVSEIVTIRSNVFVTTEGDGFKVIDLPDGRDVLLVRDDKMGTVVIKEIIDGE